MRLKIVNSNSRGNAYILENDREALLIECGMRFNLIKQALRFNLNKLVGCIVTHSHGDHCVAAKELTGAGINIYATAGTCEELVERWGADPRRLKARTMALPFSLGGFRIMPFSTVHDTKEPCGYLIHHEECGVVLFLTDTVYSPFMFTGLNNVIVEANYCERILQKKMEEGATADFLRDRVIQSHMSLQNCKDLLRANDLRQVNNVVLIHLSDSHSDEARFKLEVEQLTGKTVYVAGRDMVIENFNKTPF